MATIDPQQVKRQRDRRLRKQLLQGMHTLRGNGDGRVSGEMLFDLFGPESQTATHCEDESHLLTLLSDLTRAGYAMQHNLTRRQGQAWGLEFVEYAITAKGANLVNQSIPADPDIHDDRITE